MTALLALDGLTRRFGGLVAVNGVSFAIAPGEVVGLLGPNGSGKTTVLNMISGALRPSAGSIRLRGEPVGGLPAHRIARKGIARTFQLVRILPSLDAAENVETALAFRAEPLRGAAARAEAERLLAAVGLAGLNPTELRTGIDLIARLRDGGTTILLVEHVMEAVRALCRRCIVMNAGHLIADGDTAAVLAEPEVVRAYLGTGHHA